MFNGWDQALHLKFLTEIHLESWGDVFLQLLHKYRRPRPRFLIWFVFMQINFDVSILIKYFKGPALFCENVEMPGIITKHKA